MPTFKRVFAQQGWSEGDWDGKQKQGFGVQKFKDGKIYEGEWFNGKPHGLGTLSAPSSTGISKVYQGKWLNGQRNGLGTSFNESGERYDGPWLRGKRSGDRGELRFSNGDCYVGGFRDDMRHGNGKMLFSAGDFYEGSWVNDKQCGEGQYFYADSGSTLTGVWFDGVCRAGSFVSPLGLPKIGLVDPDKILVDAIHKSL